MWKNMTWPDGASCKPGAAVLAMPDLYTFGAAFCYHYMRQANRYQEHAA